MATLPPRRNPTPTKISKQHLTPIQILLQMGFPKQRAEKALAATGNRGVQLASDWLLAHVNDPLLDDCSPREYILYACPTGSFLEQLQNFWEKSRRECAWNGAHNFIPHITLVSFFKAPDEDATHLAQSLKSVMERQGATLDEPLKLETYTSPNFMGFFVAEEHADYLKRIAMQYVKEVSNATISLEPHVKSLHLTLAYQFPNIHYNHLKTLVDELDPSESAGWELRLYSRDPRVNSKQVHKVIHGYNPTECDELELRIGDYVYISSEVLANSPDGWVEGTSWLTGLTGFLPESYTERTAESDAWTLHKKVALNHTSATEVSRNPSQKSTGQQLQKKHTMSEETSKTPPPPPVADHEDGLMANTAPSEEEPYIQPTMPPIENIYENIAKGPKENGDNAVNKEQKTGTEARRLFLMRHGERVDFTFGTWVPYCFDQNGTYIQKDLNMPETVPVRNDGPTGFVRDTPLTRLGTFQAATVGEALKKSDICVDYAYSSPALRCIQTCDAMLRGCGKKDQVKIRIEYGLFEWLQWYPDGPPNWLSNAELTAAGYNIDSDYVPFVSETEMKEAQENCEQFYLRSGFVAKEALAQNPSGNVVLVGHASTLDVCSRELIGKKPRHGNEMTKVIQKVPYCSIIQLTPDKDNIWHISDLPFPPFTHTTNPRFDFKILMS